MLLMSPSIVTSISGLSYLYGGACGVRVIIIGNGHSNQSSNPRWGSCISHGTNTLGKGINPIILALAMGK